jgi:alpha-beta hydrolase superfamily lysophospholipase
MTPVNAAPDTIVLVHGLWVTPRSWEHWKARYQAQGFTVLAPAYPGFEVEVEALRENTALIDHLTIPEIIDHLERIVGGLDAPPILIGHSLGGVLVQILLDHGFGAAGVALNSAPTEGSGKVAPLSQLRSTFKVFRNPANIHRAVGFSFEEWRYAFTNTFTEEAARKTYTRYAIPAPGGIVWHGVLANLQPGHQEGWVDYRNDERPPLLFVSGSEDHIMPPKIQWSNAMHYKSGKTLTEVKEYEGFAHLLPAQEGWEEVADYALEWAMTNAVTAAAVTA